MKTKKTELKLKSEHGTVNYKTLQRIHFQEKYVLRSNMNQRINHNLLARKDRRISNSNINNLAYTHAIIYNDITLFNKVITSKI